MNVFSVLANIPELPVSYDTFVTELCPNADCNLTVEEITQGLKELVDIGLVNIVAEVVCPECDEFLGEFSLEDLHSLDTLECRYCGYIIDNPKELADFIIKPTERGMGFFRKYKDKERAKIIQKRLEILIRPIFAGF